MIVKVVNSREMAQHIVLELPEEWQKAAESGNKGGIRMQVLAGTGKDLYNSIGEPEKIVPVEQTCDSLEGIALPPLSFVVLRIKVA